MREPETPEIWAQDVADKARFEQAPEDRKRQVRAAHIRIFYSMLPLAVVVTLVVVSLLAVSLSGHADGRALAAWSALVLGVAAVRLFYSRRFPSEELSDAALDRWSRGAWIGALVQGGSWALLPFLVVEPAHTASVLVTIFILCALGFGCFATLGFHLPAFLGFALPIFAGVFVWFLLNVPELSLSMGVMMAVACIVMTQAGIRATRVLRGALLLSGERDGWIDQVTQEKERAQVTLSAIGDGVISVDAGGRVSYLNATAEQLTGWTSAEAAGRPLREVLRFKPASELAHPLDLTSLCLTRSEPIALEGQHVLVGRGEPPRQADVQVRVSPMVEAGRRSGAVVVLQDVTELAGLAQTLSYQAQHDSLTGLPNRGVFERLVADAMEYSRYQGAEHVLLYLDLDQFKIVNDTCGHAAGDELLRQLSERLKQRIRSSDSMARLGGDEFGILLYRCGAEKAKQLADQLAAVVRDFRFEWQGRTFMVGVSIGLVPFDGGGTVAQVMAAADAACYVAKDHGRNRIHVARPGDAEIAIRHGEMEITTHIQRALDTGLFRLRYQKIVPLAPGAPVKAEFLVSMLGEDGKLLAPGQFLPAAERFNMMPRLDRHITRLVLGYAVSERPELQGIDTYSVNLSGQSLADEAFLDYVVELLKETAVDPRRICFEITETAVIADLRHALRFIERMREIGCRFSLDDFGSGLSSFGYLKSLPVDFLKIDGQFVKNMCDDRVNHSIVEAINQVGHIMGLKTVAEFVEDERVREALKVLGVDYGQGWGLHKPALLEPLPGTAKTES